MFVYFILLQIFLFSISIEGEEEEEEESFPSIERTQASTMTQRTRGRSETLLE